MTQVSEAATVSLLDEKVVELEGRMTQRIDAIKKNMEMTAQNIEKAHMKGMKLTMENSERINTMEEKIKQLEEKQNGTNQQHVHAVEEKTKENLELKAQIQLLQAQLRQKEGNQENSEIFNTQNNREEITTRVTKVQIETENRFDVLDEMNTDDGVIRSDDWMRVRPEQKSTRKAHKVEILIDSHGNGLQEKKMYRNQDIKINVLGPSSKNIKGAKEFMKTLQGNSAQHIVVGVGGNDLSMRDSGETAEEMLQLIQSIVDHSKEAQIHILPVFERMNQPTYNTEAEKFNRELLTLPSKFSNVHVIQNDEISVKMSRLFTHDGIHFNGMGKRALVRILKGHLNSALGLKPYTNYIQPDRSMKPDGSMQPNRSMQFKTDSYKPRPQNYHRGPYRNNYPPYQEQPNFDFQQKIEDVVGQLLSLMK